MKRLLIPLLLFSAFSHSASFDCNLAETDIEIMICANQSLSQMDEVISTLYFKAVKLDGNNTIKQEQRQWLKKRNSVCHRSDSCEQFLAKRINELVDKPYFLQQILTDGMALPDEDSLDYISSSALEYPLIKEKYRPWPRKVLKTFAVGFKHLSVVVSGDDILIYYLSGKYDTPTLYEYSPLSGRTFRVADIRYYSSYYIEGNKVYYYTVDEEKGEITKRYYQIGTQSEYGELNTVKQYGFKDKDYLTTLALSNDGNKLAIATNSMERDSVRTRDDRVSEYFTLAKGITERENPAKLNTIAIYNSEADDVNIMSDDALGTDWHIDNVIWAKDDSAVYFDNSGNWACIWEYRVDDKALYKIVPEHTAEEPYPFTYQGHEYIIYAEDYHSILMIAARPE